MDGFGARMFILEITALHTISRFERYGKNMFVIKKITSVQQTVSREKKKFQTRIKKSSRENKTVTDEKEIIFA
jgi:hypothetical protein